MERLKDQLNEADREIEVRILLFSVPNSLSSHITDLQALQGDVKDKEEELKVRTV